jgi:hypothetical protein
MEEKMCEVGATAPDKKKAAGKPEKSLYKEILVAANSFASKECAPQDRFPGMGGGGSLTNAREVVHNFTPDDANRLCSETHAAPKKPEVESNTSGTEDDGHITKTVEAMLCELG